MDSRIFYNGLQDIPELRRISSKIGKKYFLNSDKKFWKIYSRCSKGLNIKHLKWDKSSSENIFWKRIREVFMVECKKYKNWEEEFQNRETDALRLG